MKGAVIRYSSHERMFEADPIVLSNLLPGLQPEDLIPLKT